jgi:hypothetical protein
MDMGHAMRHLTVPQRSAVLAAVGCFLAALILATLIGMQGMFPGRAIRRARRWLIVLLALTFLLACLSAAPGPDF